MQWIFKSHFSIIENITSAIVISLLLRCLISHEYLHVLQTLSTLFMSSGLGAFLDDYTCEQMFVLANLKITNMFTIKYTSTVTTNIKLQFPLEISNSELI